jgi:orotidine-5'-phosphate decarboxylase
MNDYAEWAEHARPLQALMTTLVGVGHARRSRADLVALRVRIAMEAGMAIGRQITRAKDPAPALRQVFDEIRAASYA